MQVTLPSFTATPRKSDRKSSHEVSRPKATKRHAERPSSATYTSMPARQVSTAQAHKHRRPMIGPMAASERREGTAGSELGSHHQRRATSTWDLYLMCQEEENLASKDDLGAQVHSGYATNSRTSEVHTLYDRNRRASLERLEPVRKRAQRQRTPCRQCQSIDTIVNEPRMCRLPTKTSRTMDRVLQVPQRRAQRRQFKSTGGSVQLGGAARAQALKRY